MSHQYYLYTHYRTSYKHSRTSIIWISIFQRERQSILKNIKTFWNYLKEVFLSTHWQSQEESIHSLMQLNCKSQIIEPSIFKNLEKYPPDFVPDNHTCLLCRIKTIGIHTYTFDEYILVDTGGQRCERRKWYQGLI